MSDLLKAALKYAGEGGYPILPLHTATTLGCSCRKAQCPSPGKHPRTAHGVKDATTDEATIRNWWQRWPDANIGIATGKISGIIVLDIDPRHGGDDSLARLQKEYSDLPACPVALTGGGGRHLYFDCGGGSIRSGTNIAPGIDIRGEGGYVVAPPSLHFSGKIYQWSKSNDCSPPPLPDWLLNLKVEPCQASRDKENESETICEGQRNTRLTRIAVSLRRQGLSEEALRDLLQQTNLKVCQPPLSEDEIFKIAASVARYTPSVEPTESQRSPEAESHDPNVGEPNCSDVAVPFVEPNTLLRQTEEFIRRFVILPPRARLPIALWIVATHLYDVFESFPYLAIESPVKQCGKTRLTEVIELLVNKPRRAVNISEAALFRLVDKDAPTLILDEAEALAGKTDRAESIRALLNAGNRRGLEIPRCVGSTHEVRTFRVYCPKVLCGIGACPDTTRDRSIVIEMQRRQVGEEVERFINRRVQPEAVPLQERIFSFAQKNRNAIEVAYAEIKVEKLVPSLRDRDIEAWEPLFAILQVVDPSRFVELARCGETLTKQKDRADVEDSLPLKLLADIRDIWPSNQQAMFSADVIARLRQLEESPWHKESASATRSESGGFKIPVGGQHDPAFELTPRRLAQLLRPFKVESRQVRVGNETRKGYHLDDLRDAFIRYLEPKEETSETN